MEQVSPRQSEIIGFARQFGRVEVEGLASHFAVTPQTIRKDLNDLCDSGLLKRVHGGAVHPAGVANVAYQSRRLIAAEAKRLIGIHAASLIPDNSSIILNIGTTTEQVARALKRHENIMVVTNNLNVAQDLRDASSAEVIVAGGVMRTSDGGIVGDATVDFIRQFKVDYAVIGASAIDADGAILDFDMREVRVSQEIIRNARQAILVADAMKFDRLAPIRIADLSDVGIIVTDQSPSDEILSLCDRHKTRVVVAAPTLAKGFER